MRTRLNAEALERRELPAAAFQNLPVLPFANAAVTDHVRAIFALGQQLGRRSNVFVKFGDSNTAGPPSGDVKYLAPLGAAGYDASASGLAATHPELLDTLAAFRTPVAVPWLNSFTRQGPGAHAGWLIADVLAALPSEINATNAAVALVMIGTNDVGRIRNAGVFHVQITRLVETLVAAGVVPVLSTIPDMSGALGYLRGDVLAYNQVIADVSATHHVPLWNAWRALVRLPAEGMGSDGVHLNASPNGGGSFFPGDLLYGQNTRNLEALQILDWFGDTVTAGPVYIAPNAVWQAMSITTPVYAVGRDVGFSPTVDVYDAAGHRVNRFLAFPATYGGGVRIATGDVNGDGFTDVICAPNGGTTSRVKVFSGKDGTVLAKWVPFGRGCTGSVSLAVGDVNGDSVVDVVVGKGDGTSGVRVYAGGSLTQFGAFRVFPGMTGGASVAVANVAGLGQVIAVGNTDSPMVRLFAASGSLLSSFQMFGGSGVGVTVAAADLNGDGFDELAVARATGTNRVKVLNAVTRAPLATFTAGPLADANYGIRLGTLRHATGTETLLVGNAPGSAVSLRGFDDLTGTAMNFPPTNANRAYGIFVG